VAPTAPGGDGGTIDAYFADAGPCQATGATCAGEVLRTCNVVGSLPDETPCAWGCLADAPGPRCAQLVPGGGWNDPSSDDTSDFTGLEMITLPDGARLDASTGAITDANGAGVFRASGTGIRDGIEYVLRPIGATGRQVAVFRFKHVTISNLTLVGTHAIALVADDGIAIMGVIDARGPCAGSHSATPGPGGYPGGGRDQDGEPTPAPAAGGGQKVGTGNNIGCGGGGYGGRGGDGGNAIVTAGTGGTLRPGPEILVLAGGSGGGGEHHSNGGRGGGGGGALHLVANGPIAISGGDDMGINAGGCGGRAGSNSNDGGGGGGSGGAILIEASTVSVSAVLAVNGGGGGGGNTGNTATFGQAGRLSRDRANGGPAGTGSAGGRGAAGDLVHGEEGTTGKGGGGGGGVGRIRINTRAGTAPDLTGAILSPGPADPETSYHEGTVKLR
jgi:hypothetical protein